MAMDRSPGGAQSWALLSKRERLIAARSAEGLTYQEISEALCIAPTTVRTHLQTIYRKLDIHNRAGLVKYAIKKKLVHVGTLDDGA